MGSASVFTDNSGDNMRAIIHSLKSLNLCFPAENAVWRYIIDITMPDASEECAVVTLREGLRTLFAEYFLNDQHPETLPSELVSLKVPNFGDAPRLWIHAVMLESILTGSHYPGFQAKSKAG